MQGPSPVETGEDPLAPYRGRILYGLASAAAVCLLPFSVNAFVQGNPGLGAGILCAFLARRRRSVRGEEGGPQSSGLRRAVPVPARPGASRRETGDPVRC